MRWELIAGAFCTGLVVVLIYLATVRATVAVLERVWG
jgi:hypothetical protein